LATANINLGNWFARREIVVPLFTWIWLVGSIVASAYFAFWLFPEIYENRTSSLVTVWLQTKNGDQVIYQNNLPAELTSNLERLADSEYLYWSACEVLPLSQRPLCDYSRNWKRLMPTEVGCTDVRSCTVTNYKLSENQRYQSFVGIVPEKGANISIADQEKLSISEPAGWGRQATWPIFFVALFLALKLGRAAGEFLFLSYEK
jgi:hypothetical protein